MLEEIERLLQLFNEWAKSKINMDFSAYFIRDFTKTLSPNISEVISTTETEPTTTTPTSVSQSIVKKDSKMSVDSQTPKSNAIQEKHRQKIDDVENIPHEKDRNPNEQNINLLIPSSPTHYPDPSIITNSRMKKTMNAISICAIEQNIESKSLPRESRNEMIALEIINDQPILKRNPETSLIKELSNQTELWKTPINAGRISIQDLIEFIINTITQDKETTKELYLDIVSELETLEKQLLLSVANNLNDSRISNDDLQSLCYEILAEIIFEEISVAKYIFNSLEPIGVENLMLGKLYRNYTAEKLENQSPFKGSTNMAHLTSEIMNYNETNTIQQKPNSKNSLEKSEQVSVMTKKSSEQQDQSVKSQKTDLNSSLSKKSSELSTPIQTVPSVKKERSFTNSLMSKKSSERSIPIQTVPPVKKERSFTNSLKSKKSSEQVPPIQKVTSIQSQQRDPNIISKQNSVVKHTNSNDNVQPPVESSTDMQTTDTEIKRESSPHLKVKKGNNSNEKLIFEGGNSQLLEIINKLNNQTNEINKIKQTLHILSNNVDEKLGNWTCKFVAPYDEQYPIEPKHQLNYGKTTKLYNTQEVVPAPRDLLITVQPSEHHSDSAETVVVAKKIENKSFIAPISNQTNEERVKTPNSNTISFATNPVDIDVLKLIGDGAHYFLTSKQIPNIKPNLLRKQDSCETFNSEFDKIFEWIIEKYQATLRTMMANSASKKIVEAMDTAPLDEKRKIERELINRIVEQNNLLINKLVKDICFNKVLDCLS